MSPFLDTAHAIHDRTDEYPPSRMRAVERERARQDAIRDAFDPTNEPSHFPHFNPKAVLGIDIRDNERHVPPPRGPALSNGERVLMLCGAGFAVVVLLGWSIPLYRLVRAWLS